MTKKEPPRIVFQDAYAPDKIARMVDEIGVRKANLPVFKTYTLAILAGAYIAFGAMFYTLVMTGDVSAFGLHRLVGGLAFSLGLVLVIIGGAELFTGNNLIVMAWADRRISTLGLLRNWSIVYVGNLVGALACAVLAGYAGIMSLGGEAVGETALAIASAKVSLSFQEAFVRGLLCNVLVCLAVWISLAAHDVAGKILAIIFPVTAFVALGFEHSIANMYFIPMAMLLEGGSAITVQDFIGNLIPVTLGNLVGGGVFVALVYWLIYGTGPASDA
ncbi:MAG: formate/nitrite transporter family protein [Alphaproteobacteria bacterium]|nr:formate/nitrite transporter family protein [Alphaproteobacteria bacterium]